MHPQEVVSINYYQGGRENIPDIILFRLIVYFHINTGGRVFEYMNFHTTQIFNSVILFVLQQRVEDERSSESVICLCRRVDDR